MWNFQDSNDSNNYVKLCKIHYLRWWSFIRSSELRCPPGVPQAACAADPCSITQCPAFTNAICVPDFCGGCNARFFLGNGKEVTDQCSGKEYSLQLLLNESLTKGTVWSLNNNRFLLQGVLYSVIWLLMWLYCILTLPVLAPSNPCELQLDPGPCRGAFPRWYYNSQTKQCQKFIYGGCLGNQNRFTDLQSCLNQCGEWSQLYVSM